MPDLTEELQDNAIFREMSSSVLELLLEDSEILELNPDEELFEQGEPSGDSFFVVLDGEIGILKNMRNRDEIVSRLDQGEFFGEFGLFSDRNRMAGGIATKSSRVLRIPRASLAKLKAKYPESLVNLYEYMFKTLAGRFKALAEKAEKTQFWL